MDGLIPNIILFVVALAVLVKASDWFVAAAEKIGVGFGIPPYIVGVTIVAFGTSLPELASSLASVFAGNSEIVVGNVIGSNITNIAMVLGIVAIVAKTIVMEKDLMRIDMPLLLASTFLFLFAIRDGQFSIYEAFLFLAALVLFLAYSLKSDSNERFEKTDISWKTYGLLILSGVLVYFGAKYTVDAVGVLSALAGIPPEVIALSLIALGTSLPELVVSIAAARKGNTEMAVGNIIGSNIFNTYAVMGIPALFGNLIIPASVIAVSGPLMLGITIIFAVMCLSKTISNWEGWMLLFFYAFFLMELFAQI